MRRRLLHAVNTISLALSLSPLRRWRDLIDPNIFEIYTRFHLVSARGRRSKTQNNSNTDEKDLDAVFSPIIKFCY